jgi:sulfopyruvate decarboxylase subunit beta
MEFRQAFEAIARRRTDELVVTSAGYSSRMWRAVTGDTERVFYVEASMSLSTMFAAGIAQGLPEMRVWAFMGDGAFAMNPGCLMVERQLDLPNMTHILVSNRVYGSTFEVPLPFRQYADFAAIARGFGIERVWSIATLDELEANFEEAFIAPGYSLVVLEDIVMPAEKLTARSQDGPEMKFSFGRHIERATGREIFTRPTGAH